MLSQLCKKRGKPVFHSKWMNPQPDQEQSQTPESTSEGQLGDQLTQGVYSIKLSNEWTLIETRDGNYFGQYRGPDNLDALTPVGIFGIRTFLRFEADYS
jgi:hypothetical protein